MPRDFIPNEPFRRASLEISIRVSERNAEMERERLARMAPDATGRATYEALVENFQRQADAARRALGAMGDE